MFSIIWLQHLMHAASTRAECPKTGPIWQPCQVRECMPTNCCASQELFGPLSMRALEDDQYVRQTQGYLPEAHVAFIDEIFKANSAILNTLLTILNERLFDNGSQRHRVPLICMVTHH